MHISLANRTVQSYSKILAVVMCVKGCRRSSIQETGVLCTVLSRCSGNIDIAFDKKIS